MVGWVWCGRTWLAHWKWWPKPHQTALGWTGMKIANQAFSSNLCAWPHKRSTRQKIPQKHSKIPWKAFQEQWKLLQRQRGTNSIWISMYLEWDDVITVAVVVMVRCPDIFVHIVYINSLLHDRKIKKNNYMWCVKTFM